MIFERLGRGIPGFKRGLGIWRTGWDGPYLWLLTTLALMIREGWMDDDPDWVNECVRKRQWTCVPVAVSYEEPLRHFKCWFEMSECDSSFLGL